MSDNVYYVEFSTHAYTCCKCMKMYVRGIIPHIKKFCIENNCVCLQKETFEILTKISNDFFSIETKKPRFVNYGVFSPRCIKCDLYYDCIFSKSLPNFECASCSSKDYDLLDTLYKNEYPNGDNTDRVGFIKRKINDTRR